MSSRSSSRPAAGVALAALVVASALGACEREHRGFRSAPPAASAETPVREGELQPGPPTRDVAVRGPYDGNAYGVSEGKRLYNQFNCSGCHFQGGGGIGPPLMDAQWIYGSAPDQIYSTISQGRPDGMPAFGGRVPAQQIWQLVAYVQSLGGQVKSTNETGRNDDQMGALPESRQKSQVPVQTGHR